MYNFILQILIMASLAVVIYLVARTIPRIDDNIVLSSPRNSFFDKIISKMPLEKLDLMLNNLLEKMLRKFKILIMKFDNVLTKWLSGFKSDAAKDKNIRPSIFDTPDPNIINKEEERRRE
ncbi:MAG: hypothetical protein M1155_02950 [Patescibacteria group bacterium]|nr:hypothetical protein [Patescibacteria group bacterium]